VDRAGGASHGFLTQDGQAPAGIVAEGKRQLLCYPTVKWMEGLADDARVAPDGRFEFRVADSTVSAGRLILATGVRDELPPVPGLAERWGRSVFHCPYCHAHEMDGGPIGVIASTPAAHHQAIMLPDWGTTTLFLNGAYRPTVQDLIALARRGAHVEATPILRIDGLADVILKDGRALSMNGLFTQPRRHMSSPLAQQLACELEEGPLGPFIKVDRTQETSVRHVFACGDAARAAGSVAQAVTDGVLAGAGAHRSTML
jgi:thioredoxin reductase